MSKRTNIPVGPLTKSDNELRQLFQSKGKLKQSALLEKIFGQPYQKIKTEQLVTFTKNISRRLYLLSKFFPPMLATIIKQVLEHPNLPNLDRTVAVLLPSLWWKDSSCSTSTWRCSPSTSPCSRIP